MGQLCDEGRNGFVMSNSKRRSRGVYFVVIIAVLFISAVGALYRLYPPIDHSVLLSPLRCRFQNGVTRTQFYSVRAVPALGEHDDQYSSGSVRHLYFDDGSACRLTRVNSSGNAPLFGCVCVHDLRSLP